MQVISNAGAQIETRQTESGDLQVVVNAAVSEMERRMAAGGSTDRVVRSTYGVRRSLLSRD